MQVETRAVDGVLEQDDPADWCELACAEWWCGPDCTEEVCSNPPFPAKGAKLLRAGNAYVFVSADGKTTVTLADLRG